MNLKITITRNTASPALRSLITHFDSAHRRKLNQAMGQEVQLLTAEHLGKLAGERHKSANDLGGTPTNHLARAAEQVALPSSLISDDVAATLTINSPGMGRAFHDVTIVPTKAKALTIPISAAAYGHRAGEFAGLFLMKGKNVLALKTPGGIVPMFVLVRSVTQNQDRSLLPSDAEFEKAALKGAEGYRDIVEAKLKGGGRI